MNKFTVLCLVLGFVWSFITTGCSVQTATNSGLANSAIVCRDCTPEQLKLETIGVQTAARGLIEYAGGYNISPKLPPLTIHVSGDATCGEFANGVSPHFDMNGNICLFNIENYPDDGHPENISTQDMMIHESLHAWFAYRVGPGIAEGFCRYVSWAVSGIMLTPEFKAHGFDPEPCKDFVHSEDHELQLIVGLCRMDMKISDVSNILRQTAIAAESKDQELTTEEFAGIVSDVLKQDSRPAFQAAGLLP